MSYEITIISIINFNKFQEIVNSRSNFEIDILRDLFINYVYPLNYDKRTTQTKGN